MLYELILINEIEQIAKIIFLSVAGIENRWVTAIAGCFIGISGEAGSPG